MNQNKSSLRQRVRGRVSDSMRWLLPGLGVKRWFLLILLGITLLGFGLAMIVIDIYRYSPEAWWVPWLSMFSLRELPRLARMLIFGGLGFALVTLGVWELNRSIISPFRRPGRRVVDELRQHRQRERGPRIVTLGGGHGLATLLRGLKTYSHNITAVVTVADDGGSSGRLRRDLGILPPGDIRNCLAALSDDEALLGQLFQYRFHSGDSELNGHSFGNLFISALAEITGSFEDAVAESGRVLAVNGRVLPATLHNVRLVADVMLPFASGEVRVEGESRIPEMAGRVRRVWLEPNSPPAFPEVIHALLSADLIVVGPGSLFTSLLPNLLVPDIQDALRASRALKIYVCNVTTQPGETDNFTCEDHVRVIEEHAGSGMFDLVLSNHNCTPTLPPGLEWVQAGSDLKHGQAVVEGDLIDDLHPSRHDPQKLAQLIINLFEDRRSHLVE
jgi:uncharacterized cofD-like protein